MALRFDPLTEADLADAVALSTEAGWNQTAADWRRLLALGDCRAGRLDGRLVATATAVEYPGEARWIGMVLVSRAWQRRGFGTAMLEEIVGDVPGGLDATELGRPLYERLGFVAVAPIDRWVGTLRVDEPSGRVEPLRSHLLDALDLDRRACGVDRSGLLGHLAGEAGVRQWVALEGGGVVGLACLRPGREHWHLGPITCRDSSVLRTLLAAAAQHLGEATVLVDAIRDEARAAVLAAAGLRVQRRLMRMTRPDRQGMLMGDQVAAATAFEWG
jgi:GNAT superfamily N-acetyltransferase